MALQFRVRKQSARQPSSSFCVAKACLHRAQSEDSLLGALCTHSLAKSSHLNGVAQRGSCSEEFSASFFIICMLAKNMRLKVQEARDR